VSIKRSYYLIVLLFFVSLSFDVIAQENPPVNEQQIENILENNNSDEIDDDSYLQELEQFINNPINLNTADESELKQLKMLTPLQIRNLITYRRTLGKLTNIYEIQAIPGWNVGMIRRILPYVSVETSESIIDKLGKRIKNGQYTFLARVSQTMEQSKGYVYDSVKNYYLGSPEKALMRYKYAYKNLLQYGITGEKDAGEQFFKGGEKQGFDFYSAHFFARNLGAVKAIAIGDYTLNMGQGLIQWQSLAFKKSSEVMNIKRQSAVLRPYNSSGEIYFHRGAAITLQKKAFEMTGFFSYRKLDANFVNDTLSNEDYVSSLETSGYHRTKSEIDDKNKETQIAWGANVSYNKSRFHIGLNGIHYKFELPITKAAALYNKYALSGNSLGDYSMDYGYTYKNMHLFGELATDNNSNKAFVNGLLISTDIKVDISLFYRNISKAYQSLYSNAFTENYTVNNEKGFYTGLSINPGGKLCLDAYTDLYQFPWLKYRIDAPTHGSDYLIQLTYTPNKQVQLYSRYHSERKSINNNPDDVTLNPVVPVPHQDWRTNLIYQLTPSLTLRSRVEVQWYDKQGISPEHGFLTYSEVLYKPKRKKYAGNIRLQYFETDGYNSRIYAYEADVLYSFSIPFFYEKGYRYYLNLNYKASRNLSFWLRLAQSVYPGKSTISSGLDEIKGDKKTEIKVQAMVKL
jgi:hypothetical protein